MIGEKQSRAPPGGVQLSQWPSALSQLANMLINAYMAFPPRCRQIREAPLGGGGRRGEVGVGTVCRHEAAVCKTEDEETVNIGGKSDVGETTPSKHQRLSLLQSFSLKVLHSSHFSDLDFSSYSLAE